jgi:hypothetical protein
MDPTHRERESVLICQLLTYLLSAIDKEIPVHITEGIQSGYGNLATLDKDTALLCSTIQNLSAEQTDHLVYNGRIKQARCLADWWDTHQEMDQKRLAEEQERQRQVELKKQALAKLTADEIKAILK